MWLGLVGLQRAPYEAANEAPTRRGTVKGGSDSPQTRTTNQRTLASGFVGPLRSQATKPQRAGQGGGMAGYVGRGRCRDRGGEGEKRGRGNCVKKEWGIFPPNMPRASSGPCGSNQRSADAQGKVEGEVGTWGMGGAGKRGAGKGGGGKGAGKASGNCGEGGEKGGARKGGCQESGIRAPCPDSGPEGPSPGPRDHGLARSPGKSRPPAPLGIQSSRTRVPEK